MVASSNDKIIQSRSDKGFAGDHLAHFWSVFSVSKRVKIGGVLALMFCGYVLIDDRPLPGTFENSVPGTPKAASRMPEPIDDLDFVDASETRRLPTEQIKSFPQRQSDASPAPVDELPQHPVGPSDDTIVTAFNQQPIAQVQRHSVRQLPRTSRQISVIRPTLRFTGRIEPLR